MTVLRTCMLGFAIGCAIGCATRAPGVIEQDEMSAPVVLSSSTPATLAFNWGNNLAIDGRGQVHAVWSEGPSSAVQVAYSRSSNDGVTWSTPVLLKPTQAPLGSTGVRVAASGDNVYITWTALYESYPRIYVIASSNAGASFGPLAAISDAKLPAAFPSMLPSIAASGHTVAIAWSDPSAKLVDGISDTHNEVYVRVSTDDGHSFGPPRPVSVPDHFSSWTPSVAVQGNEIHVAWTDERWDHDSNPTRVPQIPDCADRSVMGTDCHEEEYYRRSLDGGVSWGVEQRLTFDPPDDPTSSWAPSIGVSGSTVHLAYFDFRTPPAKIYYQRSTDDGVTWTSGEQIVSDPTDTQPALRPVLSVIGDQARIVYWRGFGAADVYITGSTDAGTTWSAPLALTQNIGATSFAASDPQVAFSPTGTNHIIWMDNRTGATQIYYARL